MYECLLCGEVYPKTCDRCPNCRSYAHRSLPVAESAEPCPKCGHILPPDRFCQNCRLLVLNSIRSGLTHDHYGVPDIENPLPEEMADKPFYTPARLASYLRLVESFEHFNWHGR